MSTALLTATDATFADTLGTGKPTLLYFTAAWCGPCRQVGPVVESIAAARDDVTIVKVDMDHAPATAQAYGIQSVPTLIGLGTDGVPVRSIGASPRPVIESLLDDLAAANS